MDSVTFKEIVELYAHPVVPQVKPEYRVLHVFSNLGVGGAETRLIALLRYSRDF